VTEFENALEVIASGQRFIVACHRRPDADAIGSAVAFASLIETLGKEAWVYVPDRLPPSIRFLAEGTTIHTSLADSGEFDARWVMDTAATELLPAGIYEYTEGGPLVIVDHHSAHDDVGDVVVRDINACATGEIVYELAIALGLTPSELAPKARTALYAAMSADTAGFRYPSTTASNLRAAASLVEAGVDPWEVSYRLFESWSSGKLRLLGTVLDSMSVESNGRLALLRVSQAEILAAEACDFDIEGLVDYGRRIDGVQVAALAWEDADGEIHLSFRSRGNIDVSALAIKFGGGGHKGAAGARSTDDLTTTLDRIRQYVSAALG